VVLQNLARYLQSCDWQCRLHCVCILYVLTARWLTPCSKIWDTATGEALYTFPHNHIVRSVALNAEAQPQYLLTVSYSKRSMDMQS
jgi:hypothetical protein